MISWQIVLRFNFEASSCADLQSAALAAVRETCRHISWSWSGFPKKLVCAKPNESLLTFFDARGVHEVLNVGVVGHSPKSFHITVSVGTKTLLYEDLRKISQGSAACKGFCQRQWLVHTSNRLHWPGVWRTRLRLDQETCQMWLQWAISTEHRTWFI